MTAHFSSDPHSFLECTVMIGMSEMPEWRSGVNFDCFDPNPVGMQCGAFLSEYDISGLRFQSMPPLKSDGWNSVTFVSTFFLPLSSSGSEEISENATKESIIGRTFIVTASNLADVGIIAPKKQLWNRLITVHIALNNVISFILHDDPEREEGRDLERQSLKFEVWH